MRVELHAKQSLAYASPATEILYGGAAGGGKSYLMRVSSIRWAMEVPGCQIYLFRETAPDIVSNHLRGAGNYLELLGGYIEAGHVGFNEQKMEFRFKNGSNIRLRHCQYDKDLTNYHGAEIHVLMMDELTHFTAHRYRFLRGRVRLGGLKVPDHLKGRLPRIECASNPGSVGHAWVKKAFITPVPPMEIWQTPPVEGGMKRQFIPARLDDNPTLTESDPNYEHRLSGLGTPELVRAMREGDWDIMAGQALAGWNREKHVIVPFEVPAHWTRFRSIDWGAAKPFSIGWWAVSDGEPLPDGRQYPRGAVIRYREWYGWTGKADTGLNITAVRVAEGILDRQMEHEAITYTVGDPAMFNKPEDGPSIAEKMTAAGVPISRKSSVKNKTNARKAGLDEFRARLEGEEGRPMLYVFETCTDGFIRTIPELVVDPQNPEDVDTRQEDHAYDEARYALMSRPFSRGVERKEQQPDSWDRAFAHRDELAAVGGLKAL